MTTTQPPGSRAAARPPRELGVDGVRRLAAGLLLLFWFTLPWEAVIRIGGTDSLARGIGIVLTIGGLAAIAVTGRRHRFGEFVGLMAVLAALVVASLWWTTNLEATEQRALTILQLLVMVLLTWEFGRDAGGVTGLMNAWLGGCLVVGLVVGVSFLGGTSATRYTVAGSSPGDVAYSLLIGIPMAWYLSLRTTRGWLVVAYRLFVPLACFAVVLTASRAGLITMAVSLLVVPLTLRWLSARSGTAVIGGLMATVVAALALSSSLAAPLARLATTSSEITSGTLDERTTLWSIGLDIMRDHPFGVGAGAARDVVSGQLSSAKGLHNTYLSIGAELGLAGLLVFLLLLVAAWYRPLTALAPLERRVCWVLLAVYLLSLSTRHADYDKSTYALLTLFALMGVTAARSTRARRRLRGTA